MRSNSAVPAGGPAGWRARSGSWRRRRRSIRTVRSRSTSPPIRRWRCFRPTWGNRGPPRAAAPWCSTCTWRSRCATPAAQAHLRHHAAGDGAGSGAGRQGLGGHPQPERGPGRGLSRAHRSAAAAAGADDRAGPLVQVTLDGVLFQDLSFYGPNRLDSQRSLTAWEMEAQRDRQHFKSVLAAQGAPGLAAGNAGRAWRGRPNGRGWMWRSRAAGAR